MYHLHLRRVGFGSVIARRYELAKRQVVDKLQHIRRETSDQLSGTENSAKTNIYVTPKTTLVHDCSHIHQRWADQEHTHRLVVDAIESSDASHWAHPSQQMLSKTVQERPSRGPTWDAASTTLLLPQRVCGGASFARMRSTGYATAWSVRRQSQACSSLTDM